MKRTKPNKRLHHEKECARGGANIYKCRDIKEDGGHFQYKSVFESLLQSTQTVSR